MGKRVKWREIGKGESVAERVRLRQEKLEKLVRKKLMNIGCFSLSSECFRFLI